MINTAIKRVAMISYHTCPLAAEEGKETGGMNVYVLELAKAIGQLGWHVDIFTRLQDPSNQPKVVISEQVTLWHVVAGPATNLSKNEMRSYVGEFAHQIESLWTQEQLHFDIIHAHYYLSGLVAQTVKNHFLQQNQATPPIVFTYHTMALMKNLVARSESEREDVVRLKAEFLLASHVSRIIAPSEIERDYLVHLLSADKDRVSVIPPGVDLATFHPMSQLEAKQKIGAELNHKVILFAGRIEPLKGLDSLLYAIKIVTQNQPTVPICLWIVGGDISQPNHLWSVELKRLDELRRLLNLDTIVKFVGQQHQSELPYYYNAAEVVVMPSHYESFGMVAAEAMACGVPVLMTNVTGISERLDEHHRQLITTAQNPLLLAEQIEQIITQPKHRESVSKSLRTKVSDLEWSQVATKMIASYEKTIKN